MMGVGEAKRELAVNLADHCPQAFEPLSLFAPDVWSSRGEPFENEKELAERVATCGAFDAWQVVVLHDKVEYARSTDKFLWATWTRFDPASDIYAKDVATRNNHIGYTGPIVIDARMKPWYPAEVEPAKETVELVDSRWNEYFPK